MTTSALSTVRAAVPRTRKGRLTRARVVKAAHEVFARDGYVAARMSDVVIAARLSTGGVYRYFGGKEDLFAAVIEDLHEKLFAASRSHRYRFKSRPFEALLAANLGYIKLYSDNAAVLAAFQEAAAVNRRFAALWSAMRLRHVERFRVVMERDFGLREVNGLPVRRLAEALACMTEQAAHVWFFESDPAVRPTVEEAARAVTHVWYCTFFHQNPSGARPGGGRGSGAKE
ncbi:MAG: TetR/AcrR family transcriptional regulator [Armatimonadota bacterium]|nr:TetR/AcrR family transcriptional regulator [Armatimonadota bacterium]